MSIWRLLFFSVQQREERAESCDAVTVRCGALRSTDAAACVLWLTHSSLFDKGRERGASPSVQAGTVFTRKTDANAAVAAVAPAIACSQAVVYTFSRSGHIDGWVVGGGGGCRESDSVDKWANKVKL